MRPQFNRLPAGTARNFAGTAIDRSRPLHFRLDGRLISGFVGDTVLSAVLASGIDTLGLYQDEPIGLTPSATPAISHASLAGDPQQALPMARTPAADGADLVALGARRINPLARLFLPGRTLGVPLDEPHALDRAWRGTPGLPGPGSDVVIVGGGVAGMNAALAAARAGLGVTLVEASPQLGGHSGLFGTQEGEEAPEADMARLRAAVAANDAITVLTSTHAYALRSGLVRVHRVDSSSGAAQGRVLDIETRHVVIATGSRERLPIFAGNRLPGVIGTLDAYELAARYGVWPGNSALIATGSNFAYRLAMLASDAGIAIGRILDARPRPASRFIEFSRAYGMVQAPGTAPDLVGIAKAGGRLSVHTNQPNAEALVTERLLVCGGWQPDLTLWHVAGGASRWHPARHRLEAIGFIEGIVLAGSAAGYFTRRGCQESGADAIDILLDRPRKPVTDPIIDPLYESPDVQTAIGAPREDAAPAFLDGGPEFLQRPQVPRRHWIAIFGLGKTRSGLTALSEAPQPLAICDVAAGVDLGLIPPGAAGIVAQERVALVPLALPADPDELDGMTAPASDEIPAFLQGRFGPDAQVVNIVPSEPRQLETGALLYRSSDLTQPLHAVGVVLRQDGEKAIALIAADTAGTGLPVTIRDRGRAIAARIEFRG